MDRLIVKVTDRLINKLIERRIDRINVLRLRKVHPYCEEWFHRYHLTLNKVDCQKASMMGAHTCGDLVYNQPPERSPTATLAKRAYYHHHICLK